MNMSGSSRFKGRTAFTAIVVFCLVLVWAAFLLQGLPASDLDDWYRVLSARETPWHVYATSFLRPWSLSQGWDGQTEVLDGIHTKRLLPLILLKFSQECFGLNPFAMYFFTKAVFFAGTVTVFFILLSQITPWLFAVLGTIVFALIPVHYTHILWLADAVTPCYFFLFLGIWAFSKIQKNISNGGRGKEFGALLALVFLIGWTGIKTKEPMLVLPIVVFLHTLFNFRSCGKSPLKVLFLNLAMAFVAFQVVPITNLGHGSVPSINFNLKTLGRMLFLNYGSGYDDEIRTAFFSWNHVFPVSIARALGFFALWSAIISIMVLVLRKKNGQNGETVSFWKDPLVPICGLWFLAEIPFLAMFQPDPRYFSGTMAPIIILVTRLAYCAIANSGPRLKKILLLLWIVSAGFNIAENVQSCISVRIMLGRKLNYFLETSRVILRDLRKQETAGDLEVGQFYASPRQTGKNEEAIEKYVFYAELGFEGWNQVPLGQDSLENFSRQAPAGYLYYITNKNLDLSAYSRIRQIGTVDGINQKSLFEKLIYSKKKKRPAVMKVYKYE